MVCMSVWVVVCVTVSSTQQGLAGASAAGLGTGCRCLESTVHVLHRSRWLSLQAGKPWCARTHVWHFDWGKLSIFHLPFHLHLTSWRSIMQVLCQDVAGTMGSSWRHCSHKYSSELKCLLPGLSKVESSVSPAAGSFFPSVGRSPLFKEIKYHQVPTLIFPF